MKKLLLVIALLSLSCFAEERKEVISIEGNAVSLERENYSIIFSLGEISLLEERVLSESHSLNAYIVVLKNRENFSLEEKSSYTKLAKAFKEYLKEN